MFVEGVGEVVGGAALAAQGVQWGYDRKAHGNELKWNEANHFMQIRQIQAQMVDTVRGQMHDFYEKKQRSLENNLLVSTLMLTIGFGFVTNGTFPKDDKGQGVVRYFYVGSAALGLVLPFLSMAAFLESRRRLSLWLAFFNEYIFQEVDYEFKTTKTYLPDLKKMRERARKMTPGLPQKQMLPVVHRYFKDLFLGRKPVRRTAQDGPEEPASEESRVLTARADSAKASKESLEEYTQQYIEGIQRAARHLLGFGVAANVFCAATLLGMYFESAYPDTPHVWILYSGIVGAGLLVWSVLQCIWQNEEMRRPDKLQPNEYLDDEILENPSEAELVSHSSAPGSFQPNEADLRSPLLQATSNPV